eukprot:403331854
MELNHQGLNNHNLNSATQLPLKFILVHYPGQPIQTIVEKSSNISLVKAKLLGELWPQGYQEKDQIQKLRFFYQGKELLDDQIISNCGFITSNLNEEGIMEQVTPCLLVHSVKNIQVQNIKQDLNKNDPQKSKQRVEANNNNPDSNSSCHCTIF